MLVRAEIWSIMFLSLRKPFISLDSTHLDNILIIILQYVLYRQDVNVIPRYCRRSLGSVVLDSGIGLIIPFPHSEGLPISITTFNFFMPWFSIWRHIIIIKCFTIAIISLHIFYLCPGFIFRSGWWQSTVNSKYSVNLLVTVDCQ